MSDWAPEVREEVWCWSSLESLKGFLKDSPELPEFVPEYIMKFWEIKGTLVQEDKTAVKGDKYLIKITSLVVIVSGYKLKHLPALFNQPRIGNKL